MHRRCSSDSVCLPLVTYETMSPVQRWDGHAREATDWNDLRRDPELFFQHGNTLIFLYSRGRSQRGPSFRIPYDFLLYSRCRPLVELSLISTLSNSPYDALEDSSGSTESYLYLHAPANLSREGSFAYHVTTRNFFAWLVGAPIVGQDPTSALVALKSRMDIWRDKGSDNFQAICDYIHEQGYGDVAQIPVPLSPIQQPTLYHGTSRRYKSAPGLEKPIKRLSGELFDSVATARQSLSRRMTLAGNFHPRPHLADLVRRHMKRKDDSIRNSRCGDDLTTNAYEDVAEDAVPSATASKPRSKSIRCSRRDSTHIKTVIPDYGNGICHPPPSTFDKVISPVPGLPAPISASSTSAPSLPPRSSRPFSQVPFRDDASPPSPSGTSTSTSSRNSDDVPSLTSTYSTPADSPTTVATPKSASYPAQPAGDVTRAGPPYNHAHGLESVRYEAADDGSGSGNDPIKIVAAPDAGCPGLIIDALIGELEGCVVGRRVGGLARSAEGVDGTM